MATVTSSKRQLTHTSNTYESNGDVTIGGNLNINGTTTTIDTANLLVEDKNIIIGDVSSPSDSTADGGGITLKGTTDKTLIWVDSTDAWTFNQNVNASGYIHTDSNLSATGNLETNGTFTLHTISAQNSENTALVINGSGVVGTRELGSNAFNSTSFLTSYTETDTLSTVTARGRVTSANGSSVWDTTTQGTSQGSLHLMSIGSDHAGGAITFDASDSNGAQAGIYVKSDGSYGTKMYLSTTDSYASGSKSAISINHQGYVNIVRGNDRLTVNGNTVWHAGNDGTGTGLDADLLDGNHASAFMGSSGMAANADVYMNFRVLRNSNSSSATDGMYIGYGNSNNGQTRIFGGGSTGVHLAINATNMAFNNNAVWHAGNDGSGSGLDADLLDGNHASAFAAASHNHDGRYYTEGEIDTIESDLYTAIGLKANLASPSFTGDVVITDDTFPFIRSSTNGLGAGIKFSDHTTGYTQNGTLTFLHGNGSSYGSDASFTLSTSEASTTILADGKLMYGEGIYSKPATGTGAGTRKDTNWDTAYTDRNKWDGGSTGLTASTGRTSLGLGSAATQNTSAFLGATAKAADSNLLDNIDSTRFIYGGTATGTTSISGSAFNPSGSLKSGFYRVAGTSSTIPNATSVNFVLHTSYDTVGNKAGFDLAVNDSQSSKIYFRPATGGGRGSWQTIWTDSSDGSGSGLDADLLDGNHASAFATASHTHAASDITSGTLATARIPSLAASKITSGNLDNARMPTHVDIGGKLDIGVSTNYGTTTNADKLWIASFNTGQSDVPGSYYDIINLSSNSAHGIQIASNFGASSGAIYMRTRSDNAAAPAGSGLQAWNKIWHHNNDGTGSGLDADLLDAQEGSYYRNATNLNAGTVAAARLSTASTQPPNDNSTKIATTAYVQTELTDLIGAAPAALDTLSELADAINDDSTFSSTVTTALGNRLRVDTASQGLNSTQKSNARTNLGLGTAATSNASAFLGATAKAADSNLLDGIDSSSFLRSDTADTATGNLSFNGIQSWRDATRWQVSASDDANQRADARDDDTDKARLHWYGKTDSGTNTNFRHAWYDGSDYVNIDVTSQTVTFDGAIAATGGNSTNWNTAYADRNKWDGGSTGLNASTGRTSLGLGSAATQNTSAFATASHNHDDRYYTETETNGFLNLKANLNGATFTGDVTIDQGSGGNLCYNLANNGVYVPHPKGASYHTTGNSHTGAIAIKFPTASQGSYDMLSFHVDIFDYANGPAGESVSLFVFGYINGATSWVNTGAHVISDRTDRDYTVRFATASDRHIVYIGETTSTWNYLQIVVRDFQAGYSANHTHYNEGWDIDVNVTSFETIRQTASANYPVSKQFKTARNIALTGAVTGNANFDGSANISIATTATADPTLTLSGDASGSATFTNLGNATLSVAVANDSHTHDGRYYTEGEIDTIESDLYTAIGLKANLASPALTGNPTAPTQAANNNSTRIATTAYVQTEISDLIGGAPGALDTLNELAAAIGDDASYASSITTALSGKSPTAGSTSLTTAGSLTVDGLHMRDKGDFITFYGDDSASHSISSRNASGNADDDIRLNSYGGILFNLDSNNNDASSVHTSFKIGRHGGATGTISDFLFTLDGESKEAVFSGDITLGDGSADTNLHIKKADNDVSDHIVFYNGTTRVGEIGCHDTTWLRINQQTAKNIYTPRYIRADGGFFVDGAIKGINGSGNFIGGTITGASDANVSNWNTAYGWGNHASAGYVTSSGNTIIGTDSDIDTSGATVIDQLNMTDGVITSHSTRTLTLANLGYTGATNANNYSLPEATATVRGGIELFSNTDQSVAANSVSATSGRTYGIQLNSAGQAVVNVPWSNTTYSAGNGISLSSTTFSVAAGGGLTQTSTGLSHSDTSSQASVNNSSGTVIQDITLDTYGHITAISSANLDGRYYTETETNSFLNLKANLNGATFTGDLTVSKTSPLIRIYDSNTGSGSYPALEFDTANNQGVAIEFNEFDGELPAGGYGLIIKESSTNTQFPTTGTLSLSVLGEIYAGSTSIGSVNRVFHDGYHPNADTLTTARTINGVSFNGSSNITVADSTKLPLSGGTVTGNVTFNSNINVGERVTHNGDSNTWMGMTTDQINFYAGNVKMLTLQEGTHDQIVINENGGDVNFRIESDLESNAFYIDGAGNGSVGILTTTPTATLDVDGTIEHKVYTVSTLPSASPAGKRAFVSDAYYDLASSHGSTFPGGGSYTIPCYSDGSNWRAG